MEGANNSNSPGGPRSGGGGGGNGGGGNNNRRRRYRGNNNRNNAGGNSPNVGTGARPQSNNQAENRNQQSQSQNRSRGRSGRVLTTNQVLVKYDNLLEQHLITRRKYFDYFNRCDERQLRRLEKNFFDSIEHLRRFEFNLEPWQREALEKRKTERYRLDLTYSDNRGWNPEEIAKAGYEPDENEDPHFKETQKEAFEAYREDNEESSGNYEDYLKYKGQA